jgi:hypothetical protein
MRHIGWEKGESQKKSGGGGSGEDSSMFLKLEAGKNYKIRLVGRPVAYLQHWEPVVCRSPGKDPNTNQVLCPLMLKGKEPKERFASWVIDRDDNNKLKVMDFPFMLLKQFQRWKEAFGDEPGGMKGPDWKISLEIPPGGTKRQTNYIAMNLDRTPFTPEEHEVFKKHGGGDGLKAKLAEIRRDHTPEEINDMLAKAEQKGKLKGAGGSGGGGGGGGGATTQAAKNTQPVVENTEGDSENDLGF